jgi:heme oxygenase
VTGDGKEKSSINQQLRVTGFDYAQPATVHWAKPARAKALFLVTRHPSLVTKFMRRTKKMILTKIREKTMEYHDDFTSWANNILNGTISPDEYKYVLKTFYGFYYPLEQKITALPEWQSMDFNIENRRKAPFLLKDMKSMGISDPEIARIEMCGDLPEINNLAQALGCMYVVEGATLGGQIVAKKLNEIFAFDQEKGAAFFNSYGPEVRPMWKSFGDLINNYSAEKQIEDPIVNAAHETYFKFNTWLSRLK